ncbi:MAG TPA: UdgX family uracil-DNA binding protein [Acidimicrobiales bacterium]|nr:UdgX family uracil-DNA binding protein [Acidimicrobiales bacterium]
MRTKAADAALQLVADEAAACQACDLYRNATQTVFGDGPAADARLVLIGEQPGDEEDRAGEPFVGPAGRLLDRALEQAHIDRGRVYVTNAVKHFKWKPKGKRRIHQRPNRTEIVACHQWLERELEIVHDDAVAVALGAVAGETLFGPSFRVGAARGQVLELDGRPVVATIHPSAVLRAPSGDEREAAFEGLVGDLVRAWDLAS